MRGVLLLDGDIVGVWRYKIAKDTLAVTLTPFRRLAPVHRRAAQPDAEAFARVLGVSDADLSV